MTALKRIHTTLLFLRRESELLLAMKKRDFGKGKWNAPGGKLLPDETPEQAAIRECLEEIGVTPAQLQKVGEIDFYMTTDPTFNHYVHVYVATEWQGEPAETDEMRPKWFTEAEIPYNQMWPDDKLWLPFVLNGKPFRASFTLDKAETIVHSEIIELAKGENFS